MGLQSGDGGGRALAVGEVDRLTACRRVGQLERPDAARRALYRVGDFLPGLRVSRVQNGMQAGDKIIGLRIEQTQDLRIHRGIASRVTGKVLQVYGSLGWHGNIPSTGPATMNATSQHAVNELARALEPIAVAVWPARETIALHGWLLRFSDGHSARANSVSTLSFDGALESAIAAAEAAYRARGLAPQFQISPASVPLALEQTLIARGYRHKTPTFLMFADVATVAAGKSVETQVSASPKSDFDRLTLEGSHSVGDGEERLAILARITAPKAYVTMWQGGTGVACGASVVAGEWASVYVMRTSPSQRRNGHGRRVLAGIAAWAQCHGARRLFLQVDETNLPARALYREAGFRDAYRYLHYVAPDG